MQQPEPRIIEFLNPVEFKVLKVIQVEGPKHSWFTGYLPYLRIYKGGAYTRETNDIIDQKILDVIKQSLPDSFLRYSIDILFKGDLEENLKAIEGGSRKNITIQFNPLLPFDNIAQYVGKEFYAYPINFSARMLFSKEQDKGHYINEYVLCYLPHEQLADLIKTIQAV